MNANSTSSSRSSKPQQGPRKLNKLLIFLGVLAFGLIVTDRVMEAFRADDDAPDALALTDAAMPPSEQSSTGNAAAGSGIGSLDEVVGSDSEALVTLENLFGSPVMLVSAAEPSFVMTEDQRRFDVGGLVDGSTTLAGVTSQQLIFEQSGDLLFITLPDPQVQ